MSYHKITVVGRLGADPEKKEGNDKAFAVFPIAVNDREDTVWYDILAFGKTAEAIMEYKKKGDTVLVEGSPAIDVWTNKEGEAAGRLKILAREVRFISTGSSGNTEATNDREPVGATAGGGDDDIPF